LARLLRSPALSLRARADLLVARGRKAVRPAPAYAAHFGEGTIYLSDDDFVIDMKSLAFVAVDDAYAGDYRSAVVVDIGAHKGYYAAYALAHGARAAVSYEPEAANFALLERAAATVRAQGGAWQTRQSAVGADPGEGELHVMGASWGHALHPPTEFDKYERGVERVRVEALADVLAEAVNLAAGARVVVKLNIEGEECPTILETDVAAWEGVDELYVETHPWADCGADELARHLEPAGFTRAESAHPAVLRLQRGEASRSARHSVPS